MRHVAVGPVGTSTRQRRGLMPSTWRMRAARFFEISTPGERAPTASGFVVPRSSRRLPIDAATMNALALLSGSCRSVPTRTDDQRSNSDGRNSTGPSPALSTCGLRGFSLQPGERMDPSRIALPPAPSRLPPALGPHLVGDRTPPVVPRVVAGPPGHVYPVTIEPPVPGEGLATLGARRPTHDDAAFRAARTLAASS
jgi:hypothetical protein